MTGRKLISRNKQKLKKYLNERNRMYPCNQQSRKGWAERLLACLLVRTEVDSLTQRVDGLVFHIFFSRAHCLHARESDS